MTEKLLLIDHGDVWPERFREAGIRYGWGTVVIPCVRGWKELVKRLITDKDTIGAAVFDADGLAESDLQGFLGEWRELYRKVPLVNFTSYCSIELARSLIRSGVIANLRRDSSSDAFRRLGRIFDQKHDFATLGGSLATSQLRTQISTVARTNCEVLINGESGVGKELVAVDIHRLSSRRNQPIIKVNCAAFAESLIEAELFGHGPGAFTGAVGARSGLFRAAHGGTLFLDEIGELSLPLQAKLLRAVEYKEVIPVGTDVAIPVDVRIVAATNRNLPKMVEDKTFREDLYHRLNTYPILISPLKHRLDDLDELLPAFIREFAREYQLPEEKLTLSQSSIDTLRRYAWPGNVRKLRSTIKKSLMQLIEDGRTEILFGELSAEAKVSSVPSLEINPLPPLVNLPIGLPIHDPGMLPYIVAAFIAAHGNASEAEQIFKAKGTENEKAKDKNRSGTLCDNIAILATDEIIRALCSASANMEALADAWGVPFSSLFKTIVKSNRTGSRIDKLLKGICRDFDGLAVKFETDERTIKKVVARIAELELLKESLRPLRRGRGSGQS